MRAAASTGLGAVWGLTYQDRRERAFEPVTVTLRHGGHTIRDLRMGSDPCLMDIAVLRNGDSHAVLHPYICDCAAVDWAEGSACCGLVRIMYHQFPAQDRLHAPQRKF